MTVNIKLNREVIGVYVSILVTVFVFVCIMWFPDFLISTIKTIGSLFLALAVSAVAGYGAWLLVKLGIDLLSEDTEDDEDTE